MATKREIEVKTTNKKFGEITVELSVSVPENVNEAAEFYGSEEKLMDAIQGDVARRRSNAARPVLRDAEQELDWQRVAQDTADAYQPGRRGGFGGVAISEEELRTAGDMDSLLALLKARGVNIAGSSTPTDDEAETEEV